MGVTHHDGMSLYGSGLYMGKKGSETIMATNASGYDCGLFRVDSGIIGQSGHVASVSTRLSSIGFVVTQSIDVLATAHSGYFRSVSWSGGAFDLYQYAITGSAATSSRVAWMAYGI